MNLYRIFVLLTLACSCTAGPIIAGIMSICTYLGFEATAIAIGASSITSLFGVGVNACWFGNLVIVNGALFWGSGAVAAGALGAGAGVAGASARAGKQLTPEESLSVLSVASSESAQSVASVSSVSKASISSASSRSVASVSSYKASLSKATVASKNSVVLASSVMKSIQSEIIASATKTASAAKASASSASAPQTTKGPAVGSTIPPPPGTPVSTLPPANRPPEVPAGVPDYNFRMCQYDIIKMGEDGVDLLYDNPADYSFKVDNIPPTCMVLASVMTDPELGPHPIVMGKASLQWDGMDKKFIDSIREVFGLPPVEAQK